MLRPLTKDEMIVKYREALNKYADSSNWHRNCFTDKSDINRDDCAGLYMHNGELARQALHYNESMMVPVKDCYETDC